MLSKALRPLPNQWDGIKDKEERFRRRYVDMTINPEVRYRFDRRAKFWNAVREFLNKNDFIEVNIPVLEHTTGGADAKPFVTHYDALGEDFYLRISHELPLKRLIGGGFEKVYDIGPRFRNEGISDEHLPEHVAMEWYWAYADYRDGMEFTTQLYRYVMQAVYGTQQFQIKGFDVDLAADWQIIDFTTIIRERFGVDIFTTSMADMNQILISNGVNLGKDANMSRVVDSLWKLIRKTIAGPAFLTGVPKFLSPLSKTNEQDPRLADRFHPLIAGSELANAFSELNDPVDQLDRFLEQQQMREAGDAEAHMLDIDYVEMLEYGMPPAVGFGLSERVFWFFENVTAKEGVPFPQLKSAVDETSQKIYPQVNLESEIKATKQTKQADTKLAVPAGIKPHDHTKRMILVLNKELAGWQLTNTIGQLSAYLGAQIGNDNLRTREKFNTATGEINANAQYPVISMTANSSEQLFNLLKRVEELGLVHLAYTQEMIDQNDDEELQKTYAGKKKEELKYLGVGIFGDNETLRELTKKFSLWK
jgi:lysyl-tRNA synthetase class 2